MRKSSLLNILLIVIFLSGMVARPAPVIAAAPARPVLAAGDADSGFNLVADFDAGIPTGFVGYADSWDGSGSATTLAFVAEAIDLPLLPAAVGNQAVKVTYNVAASGVWGGGPGYAGVTQDFAAAQDWSEYTEFSLMLYGSNSAGKITLELKSDGTNVSGASNRFVYDVDDNFTGWKLISVPFSSFANRTGYNPGPDPSAPINLLKMWGYSVMLPVASGVIYVDRVAVTGHLPVDSFEPTPTGFVAFADSWDGTGSTTTISMTNDAEDIPFVPAAVGQKLISVTYNVAASGGWGGGPGYAGVTRVFAAAQDWSGYPAFSLWFMGSNSGAAMRIELKSSGSGDASDRYVYEFTDDFTGWKLINVPWNLFVYRTDYEPGPKLKTLDLAKMWGYSILIPGGASGSFKLDAVTLYGKLPVVQTKAVFASANVTVNEGDPATVTVSLNQAAAQTLTVDYATSNGTAIAGQDYTTASGTLTFNAGDTQQSFDVTTLQDTTPEIAETINLALSNPTGGLVLGALNTATVTINDNDTKQVVVGDPFVDVVDDFEYAGTLPTGSFDAFGNALGFVTWGGGGPYPTLALSSTSSDADPLAVPGLALPNDLLKVDYDIAPGGWGGFTHIFEQGSAWVSQDWHKYAGVSFWMYGSNSGGDVNIDIFDNKTNTGDSAERWTFIFKDDFSGWKYFTVPWEYFSRKGWQPGGAPNDGLTLTEVWGYAFGFPANTGAKTIYLDNVGLMIRHSMVDNYETGLPSVTDGSGNVIGFVSWGGPGGADIPTLTSKAVTLDNDPLNIPYIGVPNTLLQIDYNISGWGGFTHAFESGTTWTSQNWSTYEGVSFWMYGNNTGGDANLDIHDNKTNSGDSAERWTYIFKDNFSGWKFFMVPFSSFVRKDWQPGGAPNDGLTKTEMWGYSFGMPVGTGAKTAYFDHFELYGSTQAPNVTLALAFEQYAYLVNEGQTATIGVKLSKAAVDVVTVDYASASGSATTGRDYSAASGTLTFQPGETLKTFDVITLQDSVDEPNETISLTLSNPTNAPLGDNKKVELSVVDDDPANPNLVDDSESPTAPYRYTPGSQVQRELIDIASGDPLAIPGQDPINSVLKVTVAGSGQASPSSTSLVRDFAQSVDWSSADGLKMWYYGHNTNQDVTVTLKTGRAVDPGPSGWVPVWGDEFDTPAGTLPDPNKWGYDLGGQGWGNNEREYYTNNAENASTDGNGNLAIVARKIDNPAASGLVCHYGPCEYTSARLLTKGRFDFAYGRAEARLKLPYGQGIWPAFWMLGANIDQVSWPTSGEIDIMENVGYEPNIVHGTVHGPGYSGGSGIGGGYTLPSGELKDAFHTYSVEWEPDVIRWYIDDTLYFTFNSSDVPAGKQWVFDHPYFLILNLAVGGYWPGYPDNTTVFPQTLLVDYVRVYQAPDTSDRFSYTFKDNFSGWQQVLLPFVLFNRAASQPQGAPNAELNLKEVWGYGYEFSASPTTQVYYIDQLVTTSLFNVWLAWCPITQNQTP